ncbi:MAG: DNA topoisomerase [Sarcina sp.]
MEQNRNLQRQKGANKLRLRPGVMLGSDDIRGVQQTFFEIVSNSIDRFKAGYGNKIIITRHKDNSFTVQDFADGLPMDWNEEEQAYNWELALRVLYAGDNYEQSDSNDGILGYNGLGLTSTQFTSEYMNVTVHKNGIKYEVKCREGRPVNFETDSFICDDTDELFDKENGALILKKSTVESYLTGTIINYKPDLKVFTDINIPIDWMRNKLKKQVVVNNGLEIVFNDELNEVEEVFKYDSLDQYIEELGQEKNLIDIVSFKGEGVGRDIKTKPEYQVSYEVSFTLNNEYPKCEYYHNSSELTELKDNATTKAIEKAFVSVVHKYLLDKKLYQKGESKVKFSDIEDSLLLTFSSKSTQTSYANQTKLAIDNKFIREFISEDVADKLFIYITENKLITEKIINLILINKRANDKALKTKLDLKSKLTGQNKKGLSNKVEGLKHCDMRNSKLEERILLVTEGVSASSTVIDSYDGRTMGCYGLKGRFISSLKATISDVMNNEPALGIINAIGAGVEIPKEEKGKFKNVKTFNNEDSNYWSIGILCDSDCWGKGIFLALLTFFNKFMPELVRQGRIYLVISPRYEISLKNNKVLYAYNENEKEELIKINKNSISHIGIIKGLGEMNKDEFWEYVLCDEARERTFIQVEYTEDKEELINHYFEILMGKDIDGRKEFIKKYITNINLDEVE